MEKKCRKKKTGIHFELFCVDVFPLLAIPLSQERTSLPSILGKPITDVEYLFIWLAGVVIFLSFFSYQRVRHLQYVTVIQ